MKQPTISLRRWIHPDFQFWGAFFVLNALLFLPFYLLDIDESRLLPFIDLLTEPPRLALTNLFIVRENFDPFRINVELVVLAALWVNVAWIRRPAFRLSALLLYFVMLAYYLYESIMRYLYSDEPIFYSHYFLVRDGLSFLLEHMHISLGLYIAAAGGLVLAIGTIVALFRLIVDQRLPAELSRATRMTLNALALAAAISAVLYQNASADPRMVVSSLAFKLEENITASVSLYHTIANYNDAEIFRTYNYARHDLARKPNLYLIFVESYGSVLYKRPDWKVAAEAMQDQMNKKLTEAGFSLASVLSESPTWGGGSWLAYTSAIFGLRMETHPQYLALMDRYQSQLPRYPDLGTYLRGQDYHYLWVTSISDELGDKQWNKYKQFYGVDEWLRYSDLDYDGDHYGWGPAPADQYVLNYTRDVRLADVDKPLAMFYITQNSHYPWDPLPSLAEDWTTLDVGSPGGDPLPTEPADHQELRQRYVDAVAYELEMLTDFILNHQDEDAIFVLVGDHQPPRVSRRADGYETPVHIVSRDPALIANLAQYGFVSGATPDLEGKPIHHESLYSLLVRTLVQTYGEHPTDAPAYLPNGVSLPDWIVSEEEPAAQE